MPSSFPYIFACRSLSLLLRQSLLYGNQFNISIRTRLISTGASIGLASALPLYNRNSMSSVLETKRYLNIQVYPRQKFVSITPSSATNTAPDCLFISSISMSINIQNAAPTCSNNIPTTGKRRLNRRLYIVSLSCEHHNPSDYETCRS
jgi:hypothetical protein